jgi:hypothetical protein
MRGIDVASSILEQLNTRTLGGSDAVTASQITSQSNPVHIQDSNKDAMETITLVNAASQRDGSPIPATGQAFNARLTDNSRSPWFTPEAGEVWLLMGASMFADAVPSSGFDFTLYYLIDDQDGVARVLDMGTTKSITTQGSDMGLLNTESSLQYVDENMQVQIAVSNMRGTSYIDVTMYAMRVR